MLGVAGGYGVLGCQHPHGRQGFGGYLKSSVRVYSNLRTLGLREWSFMGFANASGRVSGMRFFWGV